MFGLLKGLFVKGLRKVLKAGIVYFFEGLGVGLRVPARALDGTL